MGTRIAAENGYGEMFDLVDNRKEYFQAMIRIAATRTGNRAKKPQLKLLLIVMLLLLPAPGARAARSLAEAWQGIVRQPLERAGELPQLQAAICRFIKLQHRQQIDNASLYSLALIELSQRKGLPSEVRLELTRAAETISPDLAFPETELSRLYFKLGRYQDSLASFLFALEKFRNSHLESYYASTFFWLAIAFLPPALLLLLLLFFLAKYFRIVIEFGNLKLNRLGNQVLLGWGVLLAALIALVPAPLPGLLLLFLGLSLTACRRDILLLLATMTSLLIVPYAYEKGMLSLLALDSSFFRISRQSLTGIIPESKPAKRQQPARNQAQLILQLFSQAENARLRGQYRQATIFLEKIIDSGARLAPVFNNLGNLYLLRNMPHKSIPLYRKAIALAPSAPLPWYNLSLAYLNDSFNLTASSRALERAIQLQPELDTGPKGNGNGKRTISPEERSRPRFMPLTRNFFRLYANSLAGNETFLPEFLGRMMFPGAGRYSYLLLVMLELLLLGMVMKHTPANRRVCPRCGRLFHLAQAGRQQRLCFYCRPRPGRHGSPPPSPRLWRGRLAGVLLPGFYPFISNRRILSLLLLVAALLCGYNQAVCRTGIMAPFPPSTIWLKLLLPLLVWGLNFGLLLLLSYCDYRLAAGAESRRKG